MAEAEGRHGLPTWREPTAHERNAGKPWDASYLDGSPPWDIGGPQPAVVRLIAAGAFHGSVLDAGCGTGDNAIEIAAQGLPVFGIDVAGTAVAIARERADGRGLDVEFEMADALRLDRLERTFDTVLDCALFHALDVDERAKYVTGLASVTGSGSTLHLLCFSDADPGCSGPHPVSREQLSAPFTQDGGWRIDSIGPEFLAARFAPDGVHAWLANFTRI